jgi:DNA-binding transcriptional LysR family regulator
MDRLTSMSTFVRAVELGSFAATADAMNISPQMVSKHILSLEARLGTRLLQRTTRKQSLTDFGHTYYERCKLVLAEVDAADSLAAQSRAAPRGTLRITAPISFGAQTLTPMVNAYLRANPEVEIDLILNDRFVDLVEEGFEVGFRIGPVPKSSLVASPLRPFRLVACASPAYLEARGHPTVPGDLVHHECLRYAFCSTPVTGEWCFERDGRTHEAPTTGRFRTNDARSLLVAALQGCGIAYIAEHLTANALADGSLVRVLPDYTTPARPMHMITMPQSRPTPKLQTFVEAALAAFGEDGR